MCWVETRRTGVESHVQSSLLLSEIITKVDLVDVWRLKHPSAWQYTWVKVLDGGISAGRLDRFYLSAAFTNQVFNCQILPVGFTDHHLVLMEFILSSTVKPKSFWYFNVKLLHDVTFCENFKLFWAFWKNKKEEFSSLTQWWEVGKAKSECSVRNTQPTRPSK